MTDSELDFIAFNDPITNEALFTHTSLFSGNKKELYHKFLGDLAWYTRGASFLGLYLSLEVLNRCKSFACVKMHWKGGIALASYVGSAVFFQIGFWGLAGNHYLLSLLNGEPVFTRESDVINLEKVFWTIDDDNGYRPSLWHHGMQILSCLI